MRERDAAKRTGRVCLVGAGPGDPGLLTVKGLQRLREADVVVYDALANPVLLQEARADAKLIDAGKRSKQHTLTQDQTQALLVELAQSHRLVVRLKGGDPYLFGRGAEEAAYLARHGVACEVVPGVTSGIAAPAMAGVPVTHRAVASSVTFVTGHEDPTKDASAVNYDALAKLARDGGTLCFYMGVGRLGQIAQALEAGGLAGDTPVAVVQWGTHAKQRSIRSTLGSAAADVATAGIGAPAMIVVGKVVGIDEPGLDYFTTRPLFGKRVLVTRSRQQASALRVLLEEMGAQVTEAPTIEICPPASWEEVDEEIRRVQEYDWLLLTSANAVDVLAGRMTVLGVDSRAFAGVRIATVGQATTAALLARTGMRSDHQPGRALGEALAESLIHEGVRGAKLLCLRADIAGVAMTDRLTQAGALVKDVKAYQTGQPAAIPGDVVQMLRDGQFDWVTFTSASTARNLAALLGDNAPLLGKARLASIGPVTSEAMRALGLSPAVEPGQATVAALADAMARRDAVS